MNVCKMLELVMASSAYLTRIKGETRLTPVHPSASRSACRLHPTGFFAGAKKREKRGG